MSSRDHRWSWASGFELTSPSRRRISESSPGGRVLRKLAGGEQLVFFGACTVFRNLLIQRLGASRSWISSFELASLLGERDDESIGFEEVYFFVERIHRHCPDFDLFVDCDTGWSEDRQELQRHFGALAGKVALVCVQNLPVGRKDNSFLLTSGDRVAEPEDIALRLDALASACDALIALRIENNILGQPQAQILDYLARLRDLEAPFDVLLFHHKKSDIETLERFAEGFYELYPEDVKLAAVTTSYANTPDLLQRLAASNYRLIIVPNYSIRREHRTQMQLYRDLMNGEFGKVESECSSMAEIFDLIYNSTAPSRREAEPQRSKQAGLRRNLIFSPGPVNVPDEVRRALLSGDVLHREKAFQSVLRRVNDSLVQLLNGAGTHEAVLIPASGTGANEAMIACLHGKALAVVNGRYSERLYQLAKHYWIPVHRLSFEPLEPIDAGRVEEALRADPEITHILVVHHETATGILAPLRELGRIAAEHGKLLVVDGISSIGGHPFDLQMDYVAFCSLTPNKCFESLPGISYVIGRTEEFAQLAGRSRSYYLDLHKAWQASRAGEVCYTPAVQAVLAFDVGLQRFAREGYSARIERYRALAERMRAGLERLGLELVPVPRDLRSNIVTLVKSPAGVEFRHLSDSLRQRGITLYSDTETIAHGHFFVGTVGDLQAADVDWFLYNLSEVLRERGVGIRSRPEVLPGR